MNRQPSLKTSEPRPGSRRPPCRRPGARIRLESLDDRALPAFLAPVTYDTGAIPTAVVAADLNGDAVPDLAVASAADGSVDVFLGRPDGTFGPAATFATGTGPRALAAGDFDEDLVLDMVAANTAGVSLLRGTGDGGFAAPEQIDLGSNPAAVAVGDFNGDGTLDLGVTSNLYVNDGCGYYGCYSHYEGKANVLIGDGTGAFARTTTTIGLGEYVGAVVADLDGDGDDDFAAAHRDSGTVSVQLGDGAGGLGAPVAYPAGGYVGSVAAGDLNEDGHLDLAAVTPYGQSVAVLIGNGQGEFAAPRTFTTGSGPSTVLLDDFNDDDHLDVLTANAYSADVSVLLGRGDGSLSPAVTTAAGPSPRAVAAGDFDADGWVDMAAVRSDGTVAAHRNDRWWPGTGAPLVRIADAAVTEGNAGSRAATFTVRLSAPAAVATTVRYATADGTATAADYTAAAGEVTFAPGQAIQTIAVPVLGDRVPEASESFAVRLATGDAFVADGEGVATVFDNEPTVFINNPSIREGNAGARTVRFRVSLSFAYDETVTVPFATADDSATAGGDYTAAAGTVTFRPGQTARTVAIPVVGDRLPEFTETFFVDLGASANARIADGRGTCTVRDNEPRMTINSVDRAEGDVGSRRFVFTVRLYGPYDRPVTVNYATEDGSAVAGGDYQGKSGVLRFAPGQTVRTVTILVYGSDMPESYEYFLVRLTDPSDNTAVDEATGYGTIIDDD